MVVEERGRQVMTQYAGQIYRSLLRKVTRSISGSEVPANVTTLCCTIYFWLQSSSERNRSQVKRYFRFRD